MKDLVRKLLNENREVFSDNYSRLEEFHTNSCNAPNSTSKPDCFFLYLLVLQFKPKCILEAGTFIGSTAKFMAEAAKTYGGKIHTCDPGFYFRVGKEYEDTITFHNKRAEELVQEFSASDKKIDMAFYDAPINGTDGHAEQLVSLITNTKDFIFAAHDYWSFPAENSAPRACKGKQNVDAVWSAMENEDSRLYIPEFECYNSGHSQGINGCTTAIIPKSFT
jgi:hypothetical protein